ncbi:hypothetical protein [Acinetobacter baumannii]|uniref:hypothetical protein n=1 Tax=Acinetobacter baumannii TaxID=470 RepID=UPI001D1771A7|nr:hypothetical protein [Acinetobacter baumannii]
MILLLSYFFKLKVSTHPSNNLVLEEKNGEKVQANIWFPYAHKDASVIEYKITSERFDHILTLILLPRNLKVWKPKDLN